MTKKKTSKKKAAVKTEREFPDTPWGHKQREKAEAAAAVEAPAEEPTAEE